VDAAPLENSYDYLDLVRLRVAGERTMLGSL
jgi:hypothetical protein